MPKEIRNPKPELRCTCGDTWADDWDSSATNLNSEHEPFILRDAPAVGNAPQDLMERTARFGEIIIKLEKRVPRSPVNDRLISQMVGAGTSVGANYCEADDAVSGKDYKKSIGICRKESKETMFFLRMIATADEDLAEDARKLWREAKELNLIFGALWRN